MKDHFDFSRKDATPTDCAATPDELAGMQWWNSMTEAERGEALEAAGWQSGSTFTPSAADAWANHKKRSLNDGDF